MRKNITMKTKSDGECFKFLLRNLCIGKSRKLHIHVHFHAVLNKILLFWEKAISKIWHLKQWTMFKETKIKIILMALNMYTMETILGNGISETDVLTYVSKSKKNWDIRKWYIHFYGHHTELEDAWCQKNLQVQKKVQLLQR